MQKRRVKRSGRTETPRAGSLRRVAFMGAVGVLGLWLGNTSCWIGAPSDGPRLIAHRGVHQAFGREGLTGETCTAARMLEPTHDFLENTVRSMEAAFDLGADAVELDLQPTTDGRFAVFHDWTVDCRTEGAGETRAQTLEQLQQLDIGFGYTADDGGTFPFRGTGVGAMPSLEQVFERFPDETLILDLKSGGTAEGERLATRLEILPASRRAQILIYGGSPAVELLRSRLPELVTITRPRLKRCLLRYLALGWSGHVPAACARGLITVPANAARFLWGWPHRFARRMNSVGSQVVLIGDYEGGGLSQGFDDPDRFRALPPFDGWVWTDRIERLGPVRDANRRIAAPPGP